uniref:16S rRNA (cytosine(967)-C(5))-methyltransferase RsmB n=1 Tax=Lachnoclostridium phocaeense TaxID=1871021 RepID=UPI0026DA7148|nr:16S rRNA (cytosine(967)-C(5))-methyltransferase RsmB [Lachnoclostridium phocaeense]
MAKVNTRDLVVEILLLVTRDGQYSHIALNQVLEKYQYLDKSDRAFITRVTEGTLERMIELDYITDQFSKVKVKKMKPVIRAIVRSAVYQLKYMDSVPDSAVCNEAVKLAVSRGFGGLRGFVNGVLRSIARNLDSVQYPPEGTKEYLSVRYSMPPWILEQWLAWYTPEQVEQMLRNFLEEKPTSIRCNLHQISREDLKRKLAGEGVKAEEVPELPCALLISGYDYLGALPSFQEGDFQVQDISSMLVAERANPREGDYIIDVCAAPGGKALHLADKLRGTGMVQARDISDYKVGLIWDNIRRAGMENIEAVRWDATVLDEESVEKADIVIADLPCSGLGVLGRKSDLKYRMTREGEKELAALQRQILSQVWRYVKPGGKLVYSTCTINREENEENAAWFQAEYPELRLVSEEQLLPGQQAGDGFYIAVFVRKD